MLERLRRWVPTSFLFARLIDRRTVRELNTRCCSIAAQKEARLRADSAVEPTKSENITVTWRRSAECWGLGSVTAWTCDVAGAAPASSLIARKIYGDHQGQRRCLSDPDRSGREGPKNRCGGFQQSGPAYPDMPSFSSQSAICCIAALPPSGSGQSDGEFSRQIASIVHRPVG